MFICIFRGYVDFLVGIVVKGFLKVVIFCIGIIFGFEFVKVVESLRRIMWRWVFN